MNHTEILSMREEDIAQAAELEKEIFSSPWSAASFRDAVDNPDNFYYVAKQEGRVVGYVGIWGMPPEGEVCNMAVSSRCRGNHIGGNLLEYALRQAAKRGICRVFLEVRASNTAAKKLYERFGFLEIGVRRGYYHAPTEDALLMELQNLPLDI